MRVRTKHREGRVSARRAVTLLAGSLALVAIVLVLALRGTGEVDTPPRVDLAQAATATVIASTPGREGGGSGFVFDASEGLIATNFHVINGGTEFMVEVNGKARAAEIVGAAPCEDLAVLRVKDRAGLKELPLGDQSDLEPGTRVVAVGFPGVPAVRPKLAKTAGAVSRGETELRAARGILAHPGPRFLPDYPNVIQTNVALLPGYSGGPLLDAGGRVVGVSTIIGTTKAGAPNEIESYAIGVDRAKKVLAVLRTGGSLAWFGTGLVFPARSVGTRAGLPTGVVAAPVVRGTLAARERMGRLLVTAVDGKSVGGGFPGYCAATRNLASGDTATLDVVAGPKRRASRVDVRFE